MRLAPHHREQPQTAARVDQGAGHQHAPVSVAPRDAPGDDGRRHHRQRPRRHGQSGRRQAVVPHVREIGEVGEEHQRERRAKGERRQVHQAVAAVRKQRQVDQRGPGRACPQDEGAQPGHAQQGQHGQLDPAPVRRFRLRDRHRKRTHCHDQQQHADHVHPLPVRRAARLAQARRPVPQRHGAQRQVQVERRRPAEVLDDGRAQARPHGRRQPADRAPQADRHRALLLRKGVEDDRQRGRRQQRRTERLRHARRDQPGDAVGHAASGRRHQEQRHANQEHALAAVGIGQAAGRHQHGGVDDGVGVQHPGHVGRRGAREAAPERAERGVQQGGVERDQEDGDAGDPEDGPGRGAGGGTGGQRGRGDGGSGHGGCPKRISVQNRERCRCRCRVRSTGRA